MQSNTKTDNKSLEKKLILAFVGMAGSGKSEAISYVKKRGIPFIRFGDLTEQEIKKQGLTLTPDNERKVREAIRNDFGMDVYASCAKPAIEKLLEEHNSIGIDGLYSWEEYVLLKKEFPKLILVHVFSEPSKRYQRLSKRPVRPLSFDQALERDIKEIEKLHKGGPIAMADYLIDNNSSIDSLYRKVYALLIRLDVKLD